MPRQYDESYLGAARAAREKEDQEFAEEQQETYDQMVGDAPVVPEGEEQPQTTVNPLASVPDAIQNLAQGAANLVGQGDAYRQRVEESNRINEERQEAVEEAAYSNPVGAFAAETLRVPIDAAAGTIESTLDTADLLGDLARLGVNKLTGRETKETENPFSDRYVAAAYDLGFEGPKTEVGQFASKLLQFAIITRAAATRLPKVLVQLGTKGVGLKGAVASGLIPGAVADFILTNKDDGNFSSMVNNFIPEDNPLHDSFVFALRSDANDDVFTAKLKSTLEGGLVGAAADSLLWLMWGRKAGQRALSEGATQEEALATGLEATQTKMKEVDAYNTKAKLEEQDRFDQYNSEELDELTAMRTRLESQVSAYKEAGLEGTEKFNSLVDTLNQVDDNIGQFSEALRRGYEPDDLSRGAQQDNAAYNKPAQTQLAVEQHFEAEMVPGVKAAEPYNYMSPEKGSYHMMTDAQMQGVQKYSREAEDIIRRTSTELDLQEMARKLKRPVGDIIAHAARKLEDFRSALANDIPKESLEEMINARGLLDAKTVKGSKMLSKEGILVTKALIGQTAEQIHSLSQNAIQLRAAGQPIGNQLDRAVDRLVMLLEYHKTTAYETGSTLHMFKRNVADVLLEGPSSDGNLALSMKEVKEWANNVKSLMRKGDPTAEQDLMRLVNAMVLAGGDPTRQVKFWHAFWNNEAKNFTNQLYQSILSGPITHFRNAMGNTYSLIERPFSTYMKGVFKGDQQLRHSAAAGAHAIVTGFSDAFTVAKTTFKRGTSANFNAQFAMEDIQAQAMIKQLEMAATTKNEKLGARILATHYRFLNNPWVSWPSNALMAGDDFFKTLAARYRMHSKAKYESLIHSPSGADPKEQMDLFLQKFAKGIDPGTGRILDQDLLNYAERATFQQDPGAIINSLSRFVDSIPYGAGRLFMPFLRTPGNLFGYGLEHLPGIGVAIRQMDDTYKQAVKNNDRLLMAEIEGRHATGLMLSGAMVTTAMFMDVTGNYPADDKERAAWMAEGRPPFSVKVGDKWVSYKGVEPVNSFLGIIADTMHLVKKGYVDLGERIVGQLGYSIMLSYTDKSFLGGLAELGSLFDPQNFKDPNVLDLALKSFNSYMPYSGARRALSNALDPYLRATRDELDKNMRQALPGYSGGMHARTSFITGEARTSASGGFFNAVSPIAIVDDNSDYVTKELTALGYNSNSVLKTGEYGVELEPRHQEALAKVMHSLGVGKRIKAYMDTDEYKQFKEAYKGRSFDFEDFVDGKSSNYPPHVQKIHDIIRKAKKSALARLRKNDRSYLLLVAAEAYKKAHARVKDFRTPTDQELEAFVKFGNY